MTKLLSASLRAIARTIIVRLALFSVTIGVFAPGGRLLLLASIKELVVAESLTIQDISAACAYLMGLMLYVGVLLFCALETAAVIGDYILNKLHEAKGAK